jgi:hypothetical protein
LTADSTPAPAPEAIPFPDDLKELIAPEREVILRAQQLMANKVAGYFLGAKITNQRVNLVNETYAQLPPEEQEG